MCRVYIYKLMYLFMCGVVSIYVNYVCIYRWYGSCFASDLPLAELEM